MVNGRPVRLSGPEALWPLSTLLRRSLGFTGTKVVCAEGDCGACSVLLGRVEDGQAGPRLDYRAVDACILMAFQCRGMHVVTVEGLAGPTKHDANQAEPALTVVQQAMVDGHGSQCGFCTPGIVMTLHGLCEAEPADTQVLCEKNVRQGLSGNLCRCTGYQQIFDACAGVDPASVARLQDVYDEAQVIAQLREEDGASLTLALEVTDAPEPQTPGDHGVAHTNGALHTNGVPGRPASSRAWTDDPALPTRRLDLMLPTKLADALAVRAAHPKATIVSGATDVGVWRSHGWAWPEQVLCISHIQELDGCERTGDTLRMGAGCSWRVVRDAVAEPFPEYAEVLDRFGSPQIRELGTVGGNIANGSPIADSLPALFAMDAEVELASAERGARRVPITGLYTGYKQTVMEPDELITAVYLPMPQASDRVHLEKTSKRRDMDISTFTAAIRITLEDKGERIERAAVALGGVGPVVVRCAAAEQRLQGTAFELASFREAGKLARQAVTPISDVRGGADYRSQLTENVFLKAFHTWASGGAD